MQTVMMNIVNSVFLPRKTPQNYQPDAAPGGAFVQFMADVLSEKVLDVRPLAEAARMMHSWAQVQQDFVNWESVNKTISALLPGQAFALYVNKQNAGVIVSVPATRIMSVTVACFRVAASSAQVMEASGDLSGVFPGWAVTTDMKRVQNVSFCRQLADLANTSFEEMLPKTKKAGIYVPEMRDVPDPSFLTSWLLQAVAGHSLITGKEGVTRVIKKLRDDAVWKNALLPWRRSGEYTTIKVVLQSRLIDLLGDHEGLVAYKLVILWGMTFLLRYHTQLETDLVIQMLSKVARRASKLEQLSAQIESTSIIRLCVHKVLQKSCQAVINIRSLLDGNWHRIIKQKAQQSKAFIDTNELNFTKHIHHSLPTATQHLHSALVTPSQPVGIGVEDPKCRIRQRFSLSEFNLVNNHSPVEIGDLLYDVKFWVQKVLWPVRQVGVLNSCAEILNLFIQYTKQAKAYYEADGLGSSRMILTTFTIVAVLDCLAARKYPLLLDYHHGVNTSILQSLLLPLRCDMEHLADLEGYFSMREVGQALNISLISEDEPSPHSFSVRYAKQDPRIISTKRKILELAQRKKQEKVEELSRQRIEYYDCCRRAERMSCNAVTNYYGHKYHNDRRCHRCQLQRSAENMQVEIYEFPLPSASHLQDAVVYELLAPNSLLVLRDALHVLGRDVCGVNFISKQKMGTWVYHEPLIELGLVPDERLVTLCSTSKLFKNSHYSHRHPKNPDVEFILPNGLNVHLMEVASDHYASLVMHKTQPNVSSLTTLPAYGAYKSLQWTIGDTAHTENQVLARQAECPPELNLEEYKAFGTLRAGHLLQCRNISRILEMQTLSLFQPSVVNLLAQALWQAGQPACGDSLDGWPRKPHIDMREELFARYVTKQLNILVEINRGNWNHHLNLLSAVIVAARLLALSEATWEEAPSAVLRRCRSIAEDWMDRIEQVLSTMMASPVHEVQKIRTKLIEIAAIAALSFDVEARHMKVTMRNKNDATSWLRAVACIHDNALLNSSASAGTFHRNLLRRVQNTALRLEEHLDLIVKRTSCLTDFVLKHWADADQGRMDCWVHYEPPCEQWWKTDFIHVLSGRRMILQMNTLRGTFLVNGCPVARLPEKITRHEDYQRVFGSHVFQVQPAATCSEAFVSVHKLKDAVFTFLLAKDNRLVVKERHEDGKEFELFPSRFFGKDLPQIFVSQYSHWILKVQNGQELKDKQIYFRPVKFDDDKFFSEVVPFVLSISLGCLQDTLRNRQLVDICSPTFKELYDKVFHRLELPVFIHVFVGQGVMSAELPRMGLSFVIDPRSGRIWSREQPNFVVSPGQSLETLVGLRHGLLLCEDDSLDKCTLRRSLIVPHSTNLCSEMEVFSDFGRHPSVQLNLFELSSPSFFVFDVDERLRCLRGPASPTAWLYLALLHASTSHLLPDPFTGLTGSESAMRLLQSSRCWSCKPYDPEGFSILANIAKLSPTRQWYPKNLQCMQSIEWPSALFSMTALDSFHLVAEKLIKDSQRLRVLFSGSSEPPKLPENESSLLLRSYWRSRASFGPEAAMNSELEQWLGGPPASASTSINLSLEEHKFHEASSTLRTLVEAGHTWQSIPIPCVTPVSLALLNRRTLNNVICQDISSSPVVSTWMLIARESFVDHWLNLYTFAKKASQENRRAEFTFLLSLLAYCGVESQLLSVLQCVAVHADSFLSISPPLHDTYSDTNQTDFDSKIIKNVIENHVISFDTWSRDWDPEESIYGDLKERYEQKRAEDLQNLVHYAQMRWPNAFSFPRVQTVECSAATKGVLHLFTMWLHNQELHKFVSRVEQQVILLAGKALLVESSPVEAPNCLSKAATRKSFCSMVPTGSIQEASEAETIFRLGQFPPIVSNSMSDNSKPTSFDMPAFPLQVEETSCPIAQKFNADMKDSWITHLHVRHHKLQAQCLSSMTKQHLVEQWRICRKKSASLWKGIYDFLKPCADNLISQAWEAAGLWHRVLPAVLLPCLVDNMNSTNNPEGLQALLGALAVVWTLEQQAERCLRLDPNVQQNAVALKKELANKAHINWSPKLRPEWLLLELEGDYLMRPIQVDVANRMLDPDGQENSVLQLNMGEGKTSVIVPALCACISDGEQFARLTVLNSLFRVNFDALGFKLGGLLNRRLYTFPCRRDLKVDAAAVKTMQAVYQECIAKHGVVVTKPEHRLSAQLMALERCRAGPEARTGIELWNLLHLVNRKARDILDESDLILHVKYQVVYTIGEQMNIAGGALRWKVAQSVLRSAQKHCSELMEQFGPEAIEFKVASEGAFAFPHIRLLSNSLNATLCKMIADDVLSGGEDSLPIRELRYGHAQIVRDFVLPLSNDVTLDIIQDIVPHGPLLDTVLILRGLLRYGVLVHALHLRWRVNFGVKPSGYPKMAVPFRAKDVPADRAEFGHADIAIILTQLSYYNSGLTDEQLLDAFHRLYRLSTPEFEYKSWLENVPAGRLPVSLCSLSGINLDDFVQRTSVLFPVLRRNVKVVNFWLSVAVFPIECKQFEQKLAASAWDLCERSAEGRPVSGFSGTKDTNLLLPASITQHDLPELQGTDGAMIEILLRPENSSYRSFPSCFSSFDVLQSVVESGSAVLLDVGALMIDLSNREVATTWLKMLSSQPNFEAAIYFDDDNQIMAVDRNGLTTPLPLSPYHRRMAPCVIYLDDVHTRGTDLKIPYKSHAFVTLGRGITKDRLVQACMRMRMLGEEGSHSVSFWASQEVHTSILSMLPSPLQRELTSMDVLRWVIQNSVRSIRDGFLHWGSHGIAHCHKLAVNYLYDKSVDRTFPLQKLAHLNTEKEITELVKTYGGERRVLPLPAIVKSKLQNVAKSMQAEVLGADIDAFNIIMHLGRSVLGRINKYASEVECFAQVFDEEQERELEQEMEEEEEVQRPGLASPHKPVLSAHVKRLAVDGWFDPSSGDFLPMLKSLECTSLWRDVQADAWSDKLFVTYDFMKVLSDESAISGVDFLRPVAWLAVVNKQEPPSSLSQPVKDALQAVVLLSSFEADSLMPVFRQGKGARLHMIAPRLHPHQDFMVCEGALTLPVLRNGGTAFDSMPLIAQLLAFSGSAFFRSDDEQSAYCDFLGLCPRPRNEAEDSAFHRGDIKMDGFLPPEIRQILNCRTTSSFRDSPVPFMKNLLSARGWLGKPSASHVSQILSIGQFANIGSDC